MLRCSQLGGPILFIALLAPLSRQSAAWRDPSPHTVQFVTVDKDVRLEVLDWGGSCKAVGLLARGGETAHRIQHLQTHLLFHRYKIYRVGGWGSGEDTSLLH